MSGGGQTLESLSSAYSSSPTRANRAAMLRYAASHTRDVNGALAYFAMARTEMESGERDEALAHVKSASARLPELGDYLAFLKGATEYRAKDYANAAATMAGLIRAQDASPLKTDAAILGAKAMLEGGDADGAIRLLRAPGLRERQPEFDFLLGKAYCVRKDYAQATPYLQRVAFRFPHRTEAPDAQILLEEAERSLGSAFPPPTAADMLGRAEALRANRRYDDARTALESVIPRLLGEDRERAELHIAVMEYDRGRTAIAQQMLESLKPDAPEVDAERLHYLVQCARRLKLQEPMLRYAKAARERYPNSAWTMEAHRWAGNFYLLQNDVKTYVPLFRACADARPQDPESAYCHWKVAWAAYLARDGKAAALLDDHVARYPHSDKYAAALLFLGRLAESRGSLPAARSYYEELLTVEPLSHYAELAQENLGGRRLRAINADPLLAAKLVGLRGKELREDFSKLSATPETSRRLKRASLLSRVAMTDWVDLELRSYETDRGQRQLLAMDLAAAYAKDGDHFRALRTMKSMAPGYFRLRIEQAPREFWQLLFPMPYATPLAKYAPARGLDPHLVAGLIRQESEFKADAVSRAKARGLMQVLPTTGRSLTRRLKLGAYRVSMLDRPDFNINLGTYYLSNIAAAFDGRLDMVLASYNAGKSRADSWKTWGDFAEPIEFIETIPFSETREYVLSVYRNAMVYRRIYPDLAKGGGADSGVPVRAVAERSVVPRAKQAAPAKRPSRRVKK
ncbi:MAG: transglycosylase SLT domain-containing protein [Bryobacterales bacterium]|nr:transglycosylase SLT domain-containing protein [Bryobacterales bacterium]